MKGRKTYCIEMLVSRVVFNERRTEEFTDAVVSDIPDRRVNQCYKRDRGTGTTIAHR